MDESFERLKARLRDFAYLRAVDGVLSWVQQPMMPPAGNEPRATHLETLTRMAHELLVADETGRLLDSLRPY